MVWRWFSRTTRNLMAERQLGKALRQARRLDSRLRTDVGLDTHALIETFTKRGSAYLEA